MRFEKWLALTSLGLFVMFIAEMISVYNFMLSAPADFEFALFFEAEPKILQFISIGFAPALILAVVSYILSRQYGSRPVGMLIVAGGITVIAGMYVCYVWAGRLEEHYTTDIVTYMPLLFMAAAIPIIAMGIYLTRHKKVRPKKEYF